MGSTGELCKDCELCELCEDREYSCVSQYTVKERSSLMISHHNRNLRQAQMAKQEGMNSRSNEGED